MDKMQSSSPFVNNFDDVSEVLAMVKSDQEAVNVIGFTSVKAHDSKGMDIRLKIIDMLNPADIQAFLNEAHDRVEKHQIDDTFYAKVIQGVKLCVAHAGNLEVVKVAQETLAKFTKADKQEMEHADKQEMEPIAKPKPSEPPLVSKTWGQTMWGLWNKGVRSANTWTRWAESWFWSSEAPWKQKKHEMALDTMTHGLKGKYGEKLDNITFTKTPIGTDTKELIDFMQKPATDQRWKHQQMLLRLRPILQSEEFIKGFEAKMNKQPYPPEVDFLLDLCYVRFTECHNYSFCESLMDGVKKAGGFQPTPKAEEKGELTEEQEFEQSIIEDFEIMEDDSLLKKQFKAVKATPKEHSTALTKFWYAKFKGGFNTLFDSHYQGNSPYVLYDVSMIGQDNYPRNVRAIRMACPTLEWTPLQAAEIIPEFKTFLRAAQAKGEKHVYISLQQMHGSEKGRTDALIALQKEFPNTFEVCVIAQDSAWYKQKGEFKDLSKSSEFKASFLKKMFDDKESVEAGYYFPEKWKKDPVFREGTEKLMDYIHGEMFLNKTPLSVQERKNFINWYYAALELYIVRYTNSSTFNITCKDAVDRAGKENTKVFDFITVLLNKDQDPVHQKESDIIATTPAFFAKKRMMIWAKVEDLDNAQKMMRDTTSLGKRLRERLREGISLFGLDPKSDVTIKKDPTQAISLEPKKK